MSYSKDLAFIHDIGFSDHALDATLLIGKKLQKFRNGLIVDLGCGSGTVAEVFIKKGFNVYGVDISPAMIELARKKVPSAEFQVGSFLDIKIPRANAICAVGEIFNYLFDRKNNLTSLTSFLKKCFNLLSEDGFLIFDIVESSDKVDHNRRSYKLTENWAVLSENIENKKDKTLARHITSFVKHGKNYLRTDEVHQICLFERKDILKILRNIGFKVQVRKKYEKNLLLPGRAVYVCTK